MVKKEVVLKIGNMTCVACETRIENKIRKLAGILSVKASYSNGIVSITYDQNKRSLKEIKKAIESLHYTISTNEKKNIQGIAILIILIGVYSIFSKLEIFNFIPSINSSMGYFALFIAGLFTSLHCTAMCGGINIAQCMSYKRNGNNKNHTFLPSFYYNLGRVVSYTVIGGIVGALGSVISFSGHAKGLIAIIAGVFMIIMGLNLLNVFPFLKRITPKMPRFFTAKLHGKNQYGPFVVGLINGLMPCGPLQAMQIYALGTGSALHGALSMFMFSLGTVPLMFSIGALSSYLKEGHTKVILKAGALLVILLGIGLTGNGLSLSNIRLQDKEAIATNKDYKNPAVIMGEYQEVKTKLERGYPPITVKKGVPVKWTVLAEEGSINGCNNEMLFPQFNLTKKLAMGDNLIEFTPTKTGTFTYTCWMGMIKSTITVVENL